MKLTESEQVVLKHINNNAGAGTQFSILLEQLDLTRAGLQKVLLALKLKEQITEKYRHSRLYLYKKEGAR